MSKLSVSLFALLALSVAAPAAAGPGTVTLVAPSGDVSGTTLAFSWQSDPGSTWYLFWLGKGTPTALVTQQWYTAAQAGCASGGTCTILMTPPINAGGHTWFVQTWAGGVSGEWSTGMAFTVKDPVPNWSGKLPDARRFIPVLDGVAVLDNETGLVWDRVPFTGGETWGNASFVCARLQRAGRRGWRLPTITELSSLLDAAYALPAGHPFTAASGTVYWSQSTAPDAPADKMYLWLGVGVGPTPTSSTLRTWCVRSASTAVY